MNTKILNFTDLLAWKRSHELLLSIYKVTKKFPSKEDYILTQQILRAIISVTSNIAEGYGRFTYLEKARFYQISSGSLSEVHNQLIIAKDLNYISDDEFFKLISQVTSAHKLIRGLTRKTLTLNKK